VLVSWGIGVEEQFEKLLVEETRREGLQSGVLYLLLVLSHACRHVSSVCILSVEESCLYEGVGPVQCADL
jgi:hypothetical protein